MEFFSKKTNFDFMGKRKIALILSSVLLVLAVGSLLTRGLNFGIDFTGGTLIEVGYPAAADLGEIRGVLAEAGYNYGENHLDILYQVDALPADRPKVAISTGFGSSSLRMMRITSSMLR